MNPFKNFDRAFKPMLNDIVAFYGIRKGARSVAMTIDAWVFEDSAIVPADAIAPTGERVFSIVFPVENWKDVTPPQIGEWVRWRNKDKEIVLKVTSVQRVTDGDYSLSANWKSGRETPPWL